jgi:hypothetical protein
LSLSVCDHQSLEAVLAVDMEALEQFGIFEGIEADGTGQLVFQLLKGLFGYSLRFSHFPTTGRISLNIPVVNASTE